MLPRAKRSILPFFFQHELEHLETYALGAKYRIPYFFIASHGPDDGDDKGDGGTRLHCTGVYTLCMLTVHLDAVRMKGRETKKVYTRVGVGRQEKGERERGSVGRSVGRWVGWSLFP